MAFVKNEMLVYSFASFRLIAQCPNIEILRWTIGGGGAVESKKKKKVDYW